MATLSTHTLNSVDGTHAGGIPVTLTRIDADGRRTELFRQATDEGGRLTKEIDPQDLKPGAVYEMVLDVGAYFSAMTPPPRGPRFIREVVMRLEMPDPDGRYHIPFVLAPNAYSVWYSG